MAQQFDAKRLSHAYIISAPTREEGLCEARRLAAAAVCDDSLHAPCGKGRACRKADSIIVSDKSVADDIVRYYFIPRSKIIIRQSTNRLH